MAFVKATPEKLIALKAGDVVKTERGRVVTVRGSYASAQGLVIRAKAGDGVVDENIPIQKIKEVEE